MSQNNNSHRLPIQLADQFVPSCCYLVVANNILSSHCVLGFCYNGVILRPPRSSIVIVQFPIESGRCHSDDLGDSHADIFDGYVHVRLLKQTNRVNWYVRLGEVRTETEVNIFSFRYLSHCSDSCLTAAASFPSSTTQLLMMDSCTTAAHMYISSVY